MRFHYNNRTSICKEGIYEIFIETGLSSSGITLSKLTTKIPSLRLAPLISTSSASVKLLLNALEANPLWTKSLDSSSILPSIKGLNTHQRILEKDIKTHGATVHTVTSELDSGKILGQVTINILKKDTPKNLARKLIIKRSNSI